MRPIVFMCHSSGDKPFVRRLRESLERHGIRVWLDEQEIRVGESLRESIEAGLEHSDYAVVILSDQALRKPWVRKELNAAFNLEIERQRTVILPVLIEEARLPLFLRDKKYADFRTAFDDGLEELLDAILWVDGAKGLLALETVKCRVLLDVLRKDGRLVKYHKTQTHRCLKGEVRSYTEAFSSDGKIDKFRVAPGRILAQWSEGGTIYVKTGFPEALHPGDKLKREFTCMWHDSFYEEENYWEERQHHPSTNVEVVVRFPKGRPPKNWRVIERDGSTEREAPFQALEAQERGKPALKLNLASPRLYSSYILRWRW